MLSTDETERTNDYTRYLVYYLVWKMGGEVTVKYSDLRELFDYHESTCMVKDVEGGLAFRVVSEWHEDPVLEDRLDELVRDDSSESVE